MHIPSPSPSLNLGLDLIRVLLLQQPARVHSEWSPSTFTTWTSQRPVHLTQATLDLRTQGKSELGTEFGMRTGTGNEIKIKPSPSVNPYHFQPSQAKAKFPST